MAKHFQALFLVALAVALGSCQSIGYLSVDYMQPGEFSFPADLKRVGIVNNMPDTPHPPRQEAAGKAPNAERENRATKRMEIYDGDASITAESLAQGIADRNYFDEVIICDSALRSQDILLREPTLMPEEVLDLCRQLNVDFLVSVENVSIERKCQVEFDPFSNVFMGITQATVTPTVRIYLPGHKEPMTTLSEPDSIFWETDGISIGEVTNQLLPDKQVVEEASEFAGTILLDKLLPYWVTKCRMYYTGGSAHMRDAAVYARENNWPEAVRLWKIVHGAKKGKQRMQAAYNIALGYEMQDSIALAYEWCMKAEDLAYEIDNVESKMVRQGVDAEVVPNFAMVRLYTEELKKRKETRARLQTQMQRFEEKDL